MKNHDSYSDSSKELDFDNDFAQLEQETQFKYFPRQPFGAVLKLPVSQLSANTDAR